VRPPPGAPACLPVAPRPLIVLVAAVQSCAMLGGLHPTMNIPPPPSHRCAASLAMVGNKTTTALARQLFKLLSPHLGALLTPPAMCRQAANPGLSWPALLWASLPPKISATTQHTRVHFALQASACREA